MIKKIVYVGIDVDDARYHGSALNKDTGEYLAKIRKQFPRHLIKVAYEASYVGISLQRDLAERGYHCVVVAPTSIPRQGGKAIKTDRIDAIQLAQFYAVILSAAIRTGFLSMKTASSSSFI
jgi:transposase